MPSTFTPSLRLTLPATGENAGTWGALVNTGITELTDSAIAGFASIAMTDADYTLTVANGTTDQARRMMLNMTGTLSAPRNVICPTASKLYVIKNATTGGFAITLKTSAGTGISVPNGSSMLLMCDGTNVVDAITSFSSGTFTNLAYTGTLTGGTGVVNLGSGQFYKDASGNVGIGTTGPAVKLQPSGISNGATLELLRVENTGSGANTASQIVFRSAGTNYADIIGGYGTLSPRLSFNVASGGYQSWSVNSSETMRLDSSGNLGIGTSSPTRKLSVQGSSFVGSSFNGIGVQDAAAERVRLGYNDGTPEPGLVSAQISANATVLQIVSRDIASGQITFHTGSGVAERMRLDASGNLGIGTSSPAAKLDVQDTNAQIKLTSTTGTNSVFHTLNNTGGNLYIGRENSGGTSFGLPAYASTIFSQGAYPLVFSVNGSTTVIDASGNLGIGTTSPTNYGAGFKTIAVNGTSGGMVEFKVADTSAGYLTADASALSVLANGARSLNFYTNGTERMRIDASGNLGIGTSSPGQKLDVSVTRSYGQSADVGIALGGTDNGYVNNGTASSWRQYVAGNENGQALRFDAFLRGTGWAERMRLDASGNLGLGATSVQGAFNVERSSAAGTVAAGASIVLSNRNGTSGTFVAGGIFSNTYRDITASQYTAGVWFEKQNSATAGTNASQGAVVFGANDYSDTGLLPNERARIDSSGNLLVGQTATGLRNSNSAVLAPSAGDQFILNKLVGSASGNAYIIFGYNAANIGSITQSGTTAVLYNTTSDQRLKTNIVDAPDASALIDSIKVRSFDWISDQSHQRYGMVAQELFEVAPEAVHSPADPEEMMAVDYSKLVPMLVKEIQSLRARVAQLEA